MVWNWFSGDKKQSTNKSSSNSYSSQKSCKPDPSDPKYLICHEVIYDGQNKKQTTQRILLSSASHVSSIKNFYNKQSQNPLNSTNYQFKAQQPQQIQPQIHQQTLSNIPSDTKQYSFTRMYSSSRSCSPDNNDPNYVICKETKYDGNNKIEKQERLPINMAYQDSQIGNFGMHPFSMIGSIFQNDPFFKNFMFGSQDFFDPSKSRTKF